MKLVLSKATMLVAGGAVAVAAGGGAWAAQSSSKSTLSSDKKPISVAPPKAAVPPLPAVPAPGKAVPKLPVGKLPKPGLPPVPGVPALPGKPPALPKIPGLSCPSGPPLPKAGDVVGVPWSFTLAGSKDGSVKFSGRYYCTVSQTYKNPLGNTLSLQTVSVPKGIALPDVARQLGLGDGTQTTLNGATAWQAPASAGEGFLWFQRDGVVVSASGDSAIAGTMRPLVAAVQQQH